MKSISYYLKRLKDIYASHYIPVFKQSPYPQNFQEDTNRANSLIYSKLLTGKPCMISRFGSNELYATISYMRGGHPLWFLRTIYPFWVSPQVDYHMKNNAGFFNSSHKAYCKFADLMVKCAKEIDILGSWQENEYTMNKYLSCERVHLDSLVPFFTNEPWTKYLEGKKVLVVHPFKETIIQQYKKRQCLFDNNEILPTFSKLTVIKAIQSLGGNNNGFTSWFEALHYMEQKIDKADYDVALIGCGAYGMPLAAHCEKMGKQAIHLGGVLQVLFGIKGKRWETEEYYKDKYHLLMNNPNWTYPINEDKPQNYNKVEKSCYWN